MKASPMKFRTLPEAYGRPRYEALTLRLAEGGAHIGGDRPRWMPVRWHRALLRIGLACGVAWSIWRDSWGGGER